MDPDFKPHLTTVVAEREYTLVTQGGKERKVHLRFGKPRPFPRGHGYYCVYEIDGPELGSAAGTRFGGGADSVQALYLTMCQAATELTHSEVYEQGRLTLNGHRHLGLPDVEGYLESVRKDPEAQRALEKALDDLDPGGESGPRAPSGARRRQSKRRRK